MSINFGKVGATLVTSTIVITGIWGLYLSYGRLRQHWCEHAAGAQKTTGSFGIGLAGYRGFFQGDVTDNQIIGSGGGDNMLGGEGNDSLRGNGGVDFLFGEAGDDTLDGGPGTDTILGGAGNDTIISYEAFELVDGGEGFDTLVLRYRNSPYKCRMLSFEPATATKEAIFRNCRLDDISIRNIEDFKFEPAPVQGPHPKPKFPFGNGRF